MRGRRQRLPSRKESQKKMSSCLLSHNKARTSAWDWATASIGTLLMWRLAAPLNHALRNAALKRRVSMSISGTFDYLEAIFDCISCFPQHCCHRLIKDVSLSADEFAQHTSSCYQSPSRENSCTFTEAISRFTCPCPCDANPPLCLLILSWSRLEACSNHCSKNARLCLYFIVKEQKAPDERRQQCQETKSIGGRTVAF